MADEQLEVLLRPPVEFYSALAAISSSVIMAIAPKLIMTTPVVAYVASSLLGIFGFVRFRKAYKIVRYQSGLKRLPYYGMKSSKTPMSKKHLFLGKGFSWGQKHVQRLRDLRLPGNESFLEQGKVYDWSRRFEISTEGNKLLKFISKFLSSNSRLNPAKPLPPVGGKPELHAVGMYEGEKDVYMPLGERVGHALVVGTTRVGKTRLAEMLIHQDIHRGDVVIVMDPKGDADLLKRVYAEAKKAQRPCYVFSLGHPDMSARYNAIGNFERISEVATRISDQLPSEGNSAAFKEFSWRFVNIIAKALVALDERPDYLKIQHYIQDIEPLFLRYGLEYLAKNGPNGWKDSYEAIAKNIKPEKITNYALKDRNPRALALMMYCQENQIYDSALEGLISAFKYDRTYFDKIVSSLGPLLEKLTSGRGSELLAPDYLDLEDDRPIFDWKSVINQKAVVYVGLDALSDAVVAGAVGASMFADLTAVAGSIYKHGTSQGMPGKEKPPKIAIHADEFNELVGDQFIPMINKAGGANFQITAYTQTAADIEAGIGSKSKAGQIQGNFNTLIMMRVKSDDTAAFLTDQLPDVQVSRVTAISGVSDSSDTEDGKHFSSANQDRVTDTDVPMLTVNDVTSLPKGQGFALYEGGRLFKLRIPLLEDEKGDLPEDIKAIASDMKSKYQSTTPEDWFVSLDASWRDAA